MATGPVHDSAGDGDTLSLLLRQNTDVVVRALHRQPGGSDTSMSALIAARTVADVIDDVTYLLVTQARRSGHTWQEIGHLLRTTRQAAQQRFGAGRQDASAAEFASLARRSTQIVDQIRRADWDGLTADWDETMRATLSAKKVAEVWAQVERSAGELHTIGEPSIVLKGPYRIADVPLGFEHGPMNSRITFNHDGTVAGLLILLPD